MFQGKHKGNAQGSVLLKIMQHAQLWGCLLAHIFALLVISGVKYMRWFSGWLAVGCPDCNVWRPINSLQHCVLLCFTLLVSYMIHWMCSRIECPIAPCPFCGMWWKWHSFYSILLHWKKMVTSRGSQKYKDMLGWATKGCPFAERAGRTWWRELWVRTRRLGSAWL